MSDRNLTYVLIGVGIAIVLVGAIILYFQRFHTMADLEQQLEQVNKAVADAQDKQRKIPGLQAKVQALTEKIETIRAQIPVFNPKEENDSFADMVDSIRKKSRVNLVDVRYSAVRSSPGEDMPASIFRARYELKVTGGFFQLLSFLNLLETEKRFLVADNVKLLAGSVAEKPGSLPMRELQMNLSTFMQRPPPAPPGQPVAKPTDKPADQPVEERKPSTPIPD
jgi:hypothetical protein